MTRWAILIPRVALGAVFIAASVGKIARPDHFAQMLTGYLILPHWAANPLAATLPWLELTTGLALVTGLWAAGGALVAAGLLAIFMGAIGYNLANGIESFYCGCFSTIEQEPGNPRLVLLRDLALLAAALWVLAATWRPKHADGAC